MAKTAIHQFDPWEYLRAAGVGQKTHDYVHAFLQQDWLGCGWQSQKEGKPNRTCFYAFKSWRSSREKARFHSAKNPWYRLPELIEIADADWVWSNPCNLPEVNDLLYHSYWSCIWRWKEKTKVLPRPQAQDLCDSQTSISENCGDWRSELEPIDSRLGCTEPWDYGDSTYSTQRWSASFGIFYRWLKNYLHWNGQNFFNSDFHVEAKKITGLQKYGLFPNFWDQVQPIWRYSIYNMWLSTSRRMENRWHPPIMHQIHKRFWSSRWRIDGRFASKKWKEPRISRKIWLKMHFALHGLHLISAWPFGAKRCGVWK